MNLNLHEMSMNLFLTKRCLENRIIVRSFKILRVRKGKVREVGLPLPYLDVAFAGQLSLKV